MSLPITVVIPCHNHQSTLLQAVESAKDASEIIIVDDASEPPVDYKVVGMVGKQVRLQHTGSMFPSGVCHARNMGIERASNDLIVCLDADDYLLPDGLEALYGWHKRHTFVYGGYESDGIEHQAPPIGMLDRKNVAQGTFLFSRSDWLEVGGFDPRYNLGCEDYAFMIKLHLEGVQGIRIPDMVYHYTPSDNGRAAKQREYMPLIRALLKSDFPNFVK